MRSLNDYADHDSGREALDHESLKSVLVLAIHQLTYARFSPDRLFADEKQVWLFEGPILICTIFTGRVTIGSSK